MAKAVAIAQQTPGGAAIESALNTARLVYDFMYGTPERSRYTMIFCLGMIAVGLALDASRTATYFAYCM
ncbi:MAG: hypothetical protein EBV03_04550 [Proteobacteria bacterium]|nr:hypothetical protein [Pseudomonadota bacterium]